MLSNEVTVAEYDLSEDGYRLANDYINILKSEWADMKAIFKLNECNMKLNVDKSINKYIVTRRLFMKR